MKLLRNAWASLERRFGRRATVAMVVALTAPLLIALVGLTVDVGYWYQREENLQTGSDAAAIAVTDAVLNDGVTTPDEATPYALEAANAATNNQFGLTSSTVSVTNTPGSSLWNITIQAPRPVFFSSVGGLGVTGISAGTQSASSVVNAIVPMVIPCGLGLPDSNGAGGTFETVNQIVSMPIEVKNGYNCLFAANATSNSYTGQGQINAGKSGTISMGETQAAFTKTPYGGTMTGTKKYATIVPDPFASMNSNSTNPNWVPNPQSGAQNLYTSSTSYPTGVGNQVFTGTGFWEGGIADSMSNTNLTFENGIFYFGGNLALGGNATIKVINATLVFYNQATITDISASFDVQAPTTNCISAASYPESSYENAAPYDGTNNEGICGIAIYMARGDNANLVTSSMIYPWEIGGIIYAPGANVGVGLSSDSPMEPYPGDGLEIIAHNIVNESQSQGSLTLGYITSTTNLTITNTQTTTPGSASLTQ